MRTLFCIIVDDQQAAIDHVLEQIQDIHYVVVVATFTDEGEARKYLHVNRIDFIILDVELSNTDAFRFLTTLSNPRIPTILNTAHEKYEDKGYDRGLVDVLLKPVSKSRLYGALRRMNDELGRSVSSTHENLEDFYYYFQIKGPLRYERQIVWFKDIVYIDTEARKVLIHLVGGKVVYSRDGFKRVMETLPVKWFKQCYQNTAFNINFYQGYANKKVVLTELRRVKTGTGRSEVVNETVPVGDKELYPDFFDFLESNVL